VGARIEKALAARDPGSNPRTRHLEPDGGPKFTNRLILETSPYLKQHAHNPVNWYAWGEEAFRSARESGRIVFLSVGYSTCHWCHVMEEESFEDPEIAETLNRHFIAIKVDREERPDVDNIYMEAVHTLAGHGGWPMSVFLTPEGAPFYGGTYFPPRDRPGSRRPGFLSLLQQIQSTYEQEPARIKGISEELTQSLREGLDPPSSVGFPGPAVLRAALAAYKGRFDQANGGIRSRNKFPSSLPIPFLLRAHRRTGDSQALDMATKTLDAMARGGIYDHVGGGFHRYTVDQTWTVPHFEKMLYDNALLSMNYTEAFQVTGDERYAEVVRDTLAYLVREMRSDHATFYAATDADSEGEEGIYFVWTPAQVRAAVGEELAPLALAAYGVTDWGNFEGKRTVLRRDRSVEELAGQFGLEPDAVEERLERIRGALRAARSRRIPPHTDHKQIVAWNGLVISAFARAGFVLGEPELVEHAGRAARTILDRGRPKGSLARYLLDGHAYGAGLLDDHAFLIAGLIDLYQASGEVEWLEDALDLQSELDRRFFDDAGGGYYISGVEGEALLVREKPFGDSAIPSGNTVESMNLLRLYLLTTDEDYRMRAEMTVRAFSDLIEESPTGFGRMLEAVDFLSDRTKEILVVTPGETDGAKGFLRELAGVFLPNHVLAVAGERDIPELAAKIPLFEHKRALDGETTAYVCENRVCDLPARDVATFGRQIRTRPAPYPVASTGARPTP
jgi:uncharacterized protein YyaL (SSP411 family)